MSLRDDIDRARMETEARLNSADPKVRLLAQLGRAAGRLSGEGWDDSAEAVGRAIELLEELWVPTRTGR